MKIFFVLFSVLGLSSALLAAECRLAEPIEIGVGDVLQLSDERITLTDAVFDKQPEFHDPSRYHSDSDGLAIDIFNINWQDRVLPIVGISVRVHNESTEWPEEIGFSPNYFGNFNFTNSRESLADNTTLYVTEQRIEFTDERHQGREGLQKVELITRGSLLLGLKLMHPVYKIYEVDPDGTILLAFTGRHQELCLQKAKAL